MLHKTFFVNEKGSHEFIFLHRVDARYKFDVSDVTGSCVITMHFPEYSRGKQARAELEINIKSIFFDRSPRGITKSDVKEKLLDELECQKSSAFLRRQEERWMESLMNTWSIHKSDAYGGVLLTRDGKTLLRELTIILMVMCGLLPRASRLLAVLLKKRRCVK